MNSLPVEIKRMIAFQLRNRDENPHGPRDIKQFRLVNKHFSVLGAEYLLPEINLTFQSRSFERLREIAQHPFFSQHVTYLNYEADAYQSSKTEKDRMKKRSEGVRFLHRELLEPQHHEGESTKLLYDMEMEAYIANQGPPRSELRKMYKAYKAICADQKFIRQQQDTYNCQLMAQAIAQLPNLTSATLNFKMDVCERTMAFRRAYGDTFELPAGDDGHKFPYGVMQLCSILYGVDSAGIKLKDLVCGKIDWRFLRADEYDMNRIKRALRYLETFTISFYLGEHYLSEEAIRDELRECGDFLRNSRMCELLSAAKDLKTLDLAIDMTGATELEYIVGTTTWASLSSVDFHNVVATEDALIEFLNRHARTLTELGLHNFALRDGGWTSALPRIRKAVGLKDFRSYGGLAADRRWETWTLITPSTAWELLQSTVEHEFKLGAAVRKYVVEGGDCPLLDRFMYPPDDY